MNPSPKPTGFFLHPAAPLHDPGWGHPEHQGRLRALASAVSRDMLALHEKVVQVETRSATEEEILRVHTPGHLERVRRAVDQAMEEGRSIPLDPDTLVSEASWDAATGSSGAVLAAVDAVTQGFVRNAFVATRPPGHHATGDRAMGFCLFNHVAIGARYVLDRGIADRVLIVDWDVHHGNGTQEIFYSDPSVFYLSLHQHPHFPGTGPAEEIGTGEGEGTTLNVPLPEGTSRETYRERFSAALGEVEGRFSPGFVLISSGFDVLAGDPLGGQTLEPEDLFDLTREVLAFAESSARERVVVVLEGGYDPDRVGAGAVAVLRALSGLNPPE
ncbi:MAG: histone deacetylase family protein [Longimicrobiales bacterium]